MTSAVESGEISLTLPDGSVRKVSAGTTGADLAMSISPRLAKAALAVVVDDRLTDLTRPFEADARVRIITERDPEALHLYRHSTAHLLAAAVLELFPGTQCGIGPALDDGFYYDFVVQRPFVPEDLAAIEQRMREIAARDLPFVRELHPEGGRQGVLRGPRRAAQGAADRGEERPDRVGLRHQGRLPRLLRRPARAVGRQAGPLQAAVDVERLLEGRRQEPADAAGLRHRLLLEGRARAVPEPPRGSQEARPPQAGQGPRPVPFPPVGAGRGVLAGQGHDRLPHHRQLHARRAAAERLRRAEDAAGVQQGAVGDLRPLAALPPEHVPHRQRRGADGHEGHELPRPHARLRQRDAELSRPAAALPRADAAAPQRGVRACCRG